jgi:soluble lytic murein transglycosylase-like protein
MTFPLLLSLCLSMTGALPMSKSQAKNVCRYEKTILREAKANNVDPYLLASLIYVESAFLPRVVSSAGACGLTQVIPKWTGGRETRGKKYTCRQLKNPRVSIKVGARILSYVTNKYAKGNVDKGLCFYNAGTRCITKKNFYKRLNYVKKVRHVYAAITDGC